MSYSKPHTSMMSIKVIVIGAGLAGSLLANGLMRNDIDFMLYERDEKNALNREGYQIRIGDGALSGFRACLDPSRYEELMKLFGPCGSFTSSSPVLYDIRGNCLLNLGRLPWSTKTACLDRVVLRDFLTGTSYMHLNYRLCTTPGLISARTCVRGWQDPVR